MNSETSESSAEPADIIAGRIIVGVFVLAAIVFLRVRITGAVHARTLALPTIAMIGFIAYVSAKKLYGSRLTRRAADRFLSLIKTAGAAEELRKQQRNQQQSVTDNTDEATSSEST